MPKLPEPRDGETVKVKKRSLEFSYWPMYKKTRRYGLQAHVYATSPWALIETGIRERCPTAARQEALATLQQSIYFYHAGVGAEAWAAKPLLLYYSFMNLAKAYALTEGVRDSFDQAQHGLAEKRRGKARELTDAYLQAYPSPGSRGPNVFSDFLQATAKQGLSSEKEYDVLNLLPQVVAGHRLWCDAAAKRERFLPLERVQIRTNKASKKIWLELRIYAGDLTRLDMSRKRLLEQARLKGRFREVESSVRGRDDRRILRFEQLSTHTYSHRPSDEVPDVVDGFRHLLWATVTSVPPYRRYYLYAAPVTEHNQLLPQLGSMYALFYYLGSVTRYRPQQFESVIDGTYGGQVQELLSSQPSQFLYLMASEFARREVTRPAIV